MPISDVTDGKWLLIKSVEVAGTTPAQPALDAKQPLDAESPELRSLRSRTIARALPPFPVPVPSLGNFRSNLSSVSRWCHRSPLRVERCPLGTRPIPRQTRGCLILLSFRRSTQASVIPQRVRVRSDSIQYPGSPQPSPIHVGTPCRTPASSGIKTMTRPTSLLVIFTAHLRSRRSSPSLIPSSF